MKLDRRSMLKALGLGLGSALVPLVNERVSRAAPTPSPQRLVIFTTTNGTVEGEFFPSAAGALPSLADRRVLAPLDGLRSRMNVIRGVGNLVCSDRSALDGHSSHLSLLTGAPPIARGFDSPTAGGPSLDQVLAAELAADPATRTAFDHLCLGILSGSGRATYRGTDRPIVPDEDPYNVFARILLDGDANKAARLRRQRKSVLDTSAASVNRLAARLGKDDRLKTDAHLESIRELERQLDASACAAPNMPVAQDGSSYTWSSWDTMELQAKAHLDLVTAAFTCDITRIAVLPFFVSGGEGVYRFLPGVTDTHHSLAHNVNNTAAPDMREQFVRCDVWHAQMIADFAQKLASVPEAGGTLLDHTLIVWINQMEVGHASARLPIVMIGDAQGFLKTGQYVDLSATPVPHQRWLLTVAKAMRSPMTSFGIKEQEANGHHEYDNANVLSEVVA